MAMPPNASFRSAGAGVVTALLDTAERLGVARTRLLAAAGVRAPATDPEARWAMDEVIALFDTARRLSARHDLGLEFGRRVRPGTFHVLGYALMTCRTLGEAIALVPHYRRLVFDIGYSEMQLSTTAEEARLAWQIVGTGLPYSPCLAESLIAAWYSFGRWMAGVELPLRRVGFRHPAPAAGVAAYEAFFACPVDFSAADNALVFDRALLTQPLLQADEQLHLAMREQARAAMARSFQLPDLALQLRQAVIPLMPKLEATLPRAAAAMGVSTRTLQRRLAERGLQFQQVLDEVRRDLARVYLRDPALSALDVALLLGYAEQSSFTRAFKTWFACTPSAWRRAQRG